MTQNVTLCLQNGGSPVYGASQNGHTDVVDLLVQAGADIHLATTEVYIERFPMIVRGHIFQIFFSMEQQKRW